MINRRSMLLSVVVAVSTVACSDGVAEPLPPLPAVPASPPTPAAPPQPGSSQWWSGSVFDDFDTYARTSQHWTYEVGHPGAANNELQTYTESTDNIRFDGRGNLVIEAQKTPEGYTSGRLITKGKVEMMYGTIAARIKFPSGQGIWPAFWLLGSDIDSVGWPACGEIDIIEIVNTGTTYHASLHGPPAGSEYADADAVSRTGDIAELTNFGDLTYDFHVYWVTRQPNNITIGVDGATLGHFTPESLPEWAEWVFEKPMYAVLNVAVGGKWPGDPDETTKFPATMLVDWFRYTPSS